MVTGVVIICILSDWFVKTQTIGGLELLELLRHIYMSLHKWSFIMQNLVCTEFHSEQRGEKDRDINREPECVACCN